MRARIRFPILLMLLLLVLACGPVVLPTSSPMRASGYTTAFAHSHDSGCGR